MGCAPPIHEGASPQSIFHWSAAVPSTLSAMNNGLKRSQVRSMATKPSHWQSLTSGAASFPGIVVRHTGHIDASRVTHAHAFRCEEECFLCCSAFAGCLEALRTLSEGEPGRVCAPLKSPSGRTPGRQLAGEFFEDGSASIRGRTRVAIVDPIVNYHSQKRTVARVGAVLIDTNFRSPSVQKKNQGCQGDCGPMGRACFPPVLYCSVLRIIKA